jgi:hypothetical protein
VLRNNLIWWGGWYEWRPTSLTKPVDVKTRTLLAPERTGGE